MRQWKHIDPVLGVIAAYLYDSIGDVDSIRRMAYFYIRSGQSIPYDVALLAQLEGSRSGRFFWAKVPPVAAQEPRSEAEGRYAWTHEGTNVVEGPVAGVWPWMRQGWAFLEEPRDEGTSLVMAGLSDLIGMLTPARFTTLAADGGRALIERLQLRPSRRMSARTPKIRLRPPQDGNDR